MEIPKTYDGKPACKPCYVQNGFVFHARFVLLRPARLLEVTLEEGDHVCEDCKDSIEIYEKLLGVR